MPNLTKRDIVLQISKEAGIIQAEVFAVVQLTLDAITEALASGRNVELRNFGVFEVRLTKERPGRNCYELNWRRKNARIDIVGIFDF